VPDIAPNDPRVAALRFGGPGPRIGLILGKPPRRSQVIPDAIDLLRAHGVLVDVHVQDETGTLPPWIDGPVDMVALRGLRSSMLRSLLRAEEEGTRFADPPSTLLEARDRGWVHERLAEVGLAVPAFRRLTAWGEVRQFAGSRDVIVKHGRGGVGRGRRVLDPCDVPLPMRPPFPGPYIAEDRVPSKGGEVKLYRFGERVAIAEAGANGTQLELTEGHRVLAHRVSRALGLTMCGIDVMRGPQGPVVVDVNPFPSARRIADATSMVSGHLADLLGGGDHHERGSRARARSGVMDATGEGYAASRPTTEQRL
jgi:ribosomal protein S6--L-glutamate ligase